MNMQIDYEKQKIILSIKDEISDNYCNIILPIIHKINDSGINIDLNDTIDLAYLFRTKHNENKKKTLFKLLYNEEKILKQIKSEIEYKDGFSR